MGSFHSILLLLKFIYFLTYAKSYADVGRAGGALFDTISSTQMGTLSDTAKSKGMAFHSKIVYAGVPWKGGGSAYTMAFCHQQIYMHTLTITIRHAQDVLLGRVMGLDWATLWEVVLHPHGDGEVVSKVMIKMASRHLHGIVRSIKREDLVHEVSIVCWQALCPIRLPRGGKQVHTVTTGT